MAFIPVPNGIQLCFLFTTDGQHWQFCLTLRKSAGAPEDTDLAQVAADGSAWWTSNLQALLSDSARLNEVVATDLTAQGAPQHRDVIDQVGGVATAGLPNNACLVVSHRTAKRGRSYRGRSFISALTNGLLASPNVFNAGTATTFAGAFTALKVLLDGHGFDHVIASRSHNGVPTSPAETNEVISYVVDTAVDSQRRRLVGRGT